MRRPDLAARSVSLAGVAVIALIAAGCGSSGSPEGTSSTAQSANRAPASGTQHVQKVRVPDIVGERFEQAVREVKRAGLEQQAPHFTGTTGNPHYSGRCQKILKESPPAGTRLPKGSTISIVYGVCPKAIAHGHTSLSGRG
jgi:PASTA domain